MAVILGRFGAWDNGESCVPPGARIIEVSLMVRIRLVSSILIAAGVLVSTASVAEPASRRAWAQSVDDRYFQREAANYLKFENEGQTVYCTSAKTSNEALIPHIG